MKRIRPWMIWASVVAALAFAAVAVRWHGSMRLPYHDHFAKAEAGEWQAFGGAWHVEHGTIYNRLDERGAKLLTGSEKWTDYALTTDLMPVGVDGDVGVLVRTRDADVGTDSYNGYYIGLRSTDSALIIGRADYGWMEGRPVAMPGGVHVGQWYRLRVVVVGCSIGAEALNLSTGQQQWAAFEEHPCVPSGRVGLRSMFTGGAWRNVSVVQAGKAGFEAIRARAAFVATPIYPQREQDYNRMRAEEFGGFYKPGVPHKRTVDTAAGSSVEDRTIEQIRRSAQLGQKERIRAVVTIPHPLYVQDATGGIGIDSEQNIDANAGDEIEISGSIITTGVMPRFLAESFRVLGTTGPAVPVSITSTQAASGAFDGMLVEVRGVLQSKSIDPDGSIHLRLEDDAQTFTVTSEASLSRASYKRWEPGSEMRVRGVCVVRPTHGEPASAFTLLLPSVDDVVVVAGPPLWTGRNAVRLLLIALAIVTLGAFVVMRVERWRAHLILDERERLAHEMHDTLAQSFAGVGFHLQGMRNSMRSASGTREAMLEKLDVACSLVAETHRDASASIAALHPDADEGKDLLVALERCTQAMLDGNALPMTLERRGTPRSMSMPVRDALFQIGREAITNVLRHSQATAMTLRLSYGARYVELEVIDNGVGFSYAQRASGFGLSTIRRRCERVAAELFVSSEPGQGAAIRVRAPYGLRLSVTDWMRSVVERFRPQRG